MNTLARARTLTVLPRLDSDRKACVVQFLMEAGLLRKEELVVSLYGADLSGANLSEVSNLYKVDLSNVILCGADLSGTFLIEADLSNADLSGANLGEAMLLRADLREANLSGACLIGAKLHRSDLREADLSGAKGWTEEQLAEAKFLDGATMPNGQKCEEWLKSKESGEDGKNSGAS